jgi:glycosyltransferase involved in cell wall biosynthesis
MIYDHNEKSNLLREKFSIPKDTILFINQGALRPYRNVDLLLDVFKELPTKYHIVFMGYGSMVPIILDASEKHTNIHYKKTVEAKDIFKWTSSADIGIHLGRNECLSYVYANPNKIFEFLCSHLPIFINFNKPEMKNLIEQFNCGWGTENNKSDIIKKIKSINKKNLLDKTEGAVSSTKELNWKIERKEIVKVFNKYLPNNHEEKISAGSSFSSTY